MSQPTASGPDPSAAHPQLVTQVKRLRVDAMLGKKKHFNAADRKDLRVTLTSWIPIALSLLLASAFFFKTQQYYPTVTPLLGTALGLLAAFSSWLDSAYGALPFRHRVVAQRFLDLQKECEDVLAAYHDAVIDLTNLRVKLDSLRARYTLANADASHLPISRRDFELARAGIQDGEEHYRTDELDP